MRCAPWIKLCLKLHLLPITSYTFLLFNNSYPRVLSQGSGWHAMHKPPSTLPQVLQHFLQFHQHLELNEFHEFGLYMMLVPDPNTCGPDLPDSS